MYYWWLKNFNKNNQPCQDQDVSFRETPYGLDSSAVWFRGSYLALYWLKQWSHTENTLSSFSVSNSFSLQYVLLRVHLSMGGKDVDMERRWPMGVESLGWVSEDKGLVS